MRLFRARLTLRRLMIAVAVAAVLLGGWAEVRRLGHLSRLYHARARSHQQEGSDALDRGRSLTSIYQRFVAERSTADLGDFRVVFGVTDDQLATTKRQIEQATHQADYYRTLAEKYEHAARYPWLPLPPDPPNPYLFSL